MADHIIESVGRAQWPAVSALLARAFHGDPIFSWIVPDPRARARAARGHFAIECRDIALRHGRSLAVAAQPGRGSGSAQYGAAALVLPPGAWNMPGAVAFLRGPAYTRAFGTRLPRAMAFGLRIEARHPREPHVYLAYIGAAPEALGTGVGSALLRKITDQCDHDGHAAYLEASSPRNAPLYRRFGFETRETVRPFGAPPMELMWREPR